MKKKEYKIANGESVETFWLDGFEGYAKCGAFFRSRIHIDIDEFESKLHPWNVSYTTGFWSVSLNLRTITVNEP